jgi:hypothetical protein
MLDIAKTSTDKQKTDVKSRLHMMEYVVKIINLYISNPKSMHSLREIEIINYKKRER